MQGEIKYMFNYINMMRYMYLAEFIKIVLSIYWIFGKNEKVRRNITIFYYFSVIDVLIGFVTKNIFIIVLSLIISTFFVFNNRINVNKIKEFCYIYILFFQLDYIAIKTALFICDIDFEIASDYDVCEIIPNEYRTINIILAISIISTLFLTSIYLYCMKKKNRKINFNLNSFTYGVLGIIGSLYAQTMSNEILGGEWQDIFLPLFNVEYNDNKITIAMVIILAIAIKMIIMKFRKKPIILEN